MMASAIQNLIPDGQMAHCFWIMIWNTRRSFDIFWPVLTLRSRRPGTGPQNGNSRKVLAGVLAQVLAKMGVLAGVLAQVLAGRALWENRDKTACQHLCQHSGQHPHFCEHLCQHPCQHFSGIPILGSCTRSPGS